MVQKVEFEEPFEGLKQINIQKSDLVHFDNSRLLFLHEWLVDLVRHPVRLVLWSLYHFLPAKEHMDLLGSTFAKHDLLWFGFGPLAPVSNFESCLTWLFSGEDSMFVTLLSLNTKFLVSDILSPYVPVIGYM